MKSFPIYLSMIVASCATASHAEIAYSSFGDNYAFRQSGFSINGPMANPHQVLATLFDCQLTGRLTSIKVPVFCVTYNKGLIVTLRKNTANDQIGDVIANWSVEDPFFGQPAWGILTINNDLPSVNLVYGERYWVQFNAFADGRHGWGQTPENTVSRMSYSQDREKTFQYFQQRTLAMEVNVNPNE